MDYPDVTTVIQVGMPSDKAQYVHRLGRTARAGKQGRGVLLLGDFEARSFLPQIRDQKVTMQEATRSADGAGFQAAHAAVLGALKKMDPKSIGMGCVRACGRAGGRAGVCARSVPARACVRA